MILANYGECCVSTAAISLENGKCCACSVRISTVSVYCCDKTDILSAVLTLLDIVLSLAKVLVLLE
jgi:hypothetical protein